jgi:hypothetical protein
VLDESRVVGVPRIEEVGARRDTYLFFEFGDNLSGEVELRVAVLVEAERERIRCFLVGVEGVDDVLAPDSVAFSVIVEVADAGDFVPGFLVDRVVDNDVAVLCPPRLTVFLQFFEPFVVELLFVPVVLCEELVERAFAVRWTLLCRLAEQHANNGRTMMRDSRYVTNTAYSRAESLVISRFRCIIQERRWKDFPCDSRHGLVAASNKTCDVGFRVLGLMIRE